MWRKPGLRQTEEAVQERRTRIQAELGLQTRKNDLDTAVERQRPTETDQRNAIDDYRAYQQIKSELDIMESYAGDYQDTIDDLEAQEAKDHPDEYRPREHFNDEFIHAMGDHARQILRECHYTPLTRAGFELKSFDITVNGEDKTRSHGKGYHSYLNTALMLTLRRYLAEHPHNSGITIIDTPLLGLDTGKGPDMPDDMKAGLFQYLLDHQTEGQTIIIENTEHVPPLDYEARGATVITFTKTHQPGTRYGFLNGVE